MDLIAQLKILIKALHNANIPYALCGGLAMAVHGPPRATVDIDILIEESSLEDMKSIGRDNGYAIDAGLMSFRKGAMKMYRLKKIENGDDDALMLDMILVTPDIASAWNTRITVEWEEGPLSVVSREGLIVMKRLRNSGTDRDDIRFLRDEDDDR